MLKILIGENKISFLLPNDQDEEEWVDYVLDKTFINFINMNFYKEGSNEIIEDLDLDKTTNPFIGLYIGFNNLFRNDVIAESIKTYREAIEYVLNIDNSELSELNTYTRYYNYQNLINPAFTDFKVQTAYICRRKNNAPKMVNNIPAEPVSTSMKDSEVELLRIYLLSKQEEALYISFMKMVEEKAIVKKCKHCSKYFIPEGRIDTEYCNNIAPNSSKTCLEIGAIQTYHAKAKENPILMAFQKEYKKMNARIRLKKINRLEFEEWSKKARDLRDIAINNNWDEEYFLEELKKLEV